MDIISIFVWVGIAGIVIATSAVVIVGCFAIRAQGRQGAGLQQSTSSSFTPAPASYRDGPYASWDSATGRLVNHNLPEGWVNGPDGDMIFKGAPDSFKPKFESFETVMRKQLGEKEFMKACWEPVIQERLRYGDEVTRQALWIYGQGSRPRNDPDVCRIEAFYWGGKRDGEDFVTWYNRYSQKLLQERRREAEERFRHRPNLKENHEKAMRKQEEEGLCIGVTETNGSQYQQWWKDGVMYKQK